MRPRREDIEQVLGRLPAPTLGAGLYLIDILFKIGPVEKEAPISAYTLDSWEKRRDIQLQPWEADLITDLSRAYLAEMYAARTLGAQPAWKPAVAMWRYVRDQIDTPRLREALNEKVKDANGTRKRHRNPPAG